MTNPTLELQPAEQARRLQNAVTTGTVEEIDLARARARVKIGDNSTTWVQWTTGAAGQTRSWNAPDIGEQVVLAAPYGDLAGAIIIGRLYQTAHPAPESSGDVDRTTYPDGATMAYDRAGHALTTELPAGGTVTMTAPGGITITAGGYTLTAPSATITAPTITLSGNCSISGALSVAGPITAAGGINASGGAGATMRVEGDIEAKGKVVADADATKISLHTHQNSGVLPGGGNSAAPVPNT